jgi:hypothetical protein
LVGVFGIGENDNERSFFPARREVTERLVVIGLNGLSLGVVESFEKASDLRFASARRNVFFNRVVEEHETDLVTGTFGGVEEQESGIEAMVELSYTIDFSEHVAAHVDADHNALVGFLFKISDDKLAPPCGCLPVDFSVVVFVVIAERFEFHAKALDSALAHTEVAEVSGLFEELKFFDCFNVRINTHSVGRQDLFLNLGDSEGARVSDKEATKFPLTTACWNESVFFYFCFASFEADFELIPFGGAVLGDFISDFDGNRVIPVIFEFDLDGVFDSN